MTRPRESQNQTQVTQMLELSDLEFEITLSRMLTTLMEKADNVEEKISNVNTEREL